MKHNKYSVFPFARKALAIAAMAAALGACSSNSDNKGPSYTGPSDNGGETPTEGETRVLAEMSDNGYTIEFIENCGENPQNAENSIVFQDETMENLAGGGSIAMHAYPEGATEPQAPWDGLNLDPNAPLYDLKNLEATEDESCNGLMTKTGVLVTKYADWHHQHSNEFIPLVVDENKTFADVESVIIELKLNSENTVIVDNAELATIYDAKLAEAHEAAQASLAETSADPEQDDKFFPRDDIDLNDFDYNRLDQEKAVLAVSLQNAATGADNVQAERYVEIDPEMYADKWIRITIPYNTMDLYTGEVWEKKAPGENLESNTPVNRLHVVGEILGTGDVETQYGDVLRNYIGSPQDDALYDSIGIPETFKEMSVTIKKVEVVWK